MSSRPLTVDVANAIWDVLVSEAGADEDERGSFIAHVTRIGLTEYRFMGTLGFGGKVWHDPIAGRRRAFKLANNIVPDERDREFYVNCYREDRTLERVVTIQRVNEALAEVVTWPLPPLTKLKAALASYDAQYGARGLGEQHPELPRGCVERVEALVWEVRAIVDAN